MKALVAIAVVLAFSATVVYVLWSAPDRPDAAVGVVRPAEAAVPQLEPDPIVPMRPLGAPPDETGTAAEEPSTRPRTERVEVAVAEGPPIRASVSGAIVSRRRGPIEGALVQVFVKGRPLAEAQSDEQGRFVLAIDRAFSGGALRVQARGYAPFETELSVPPRSTGSLMGNVLLQEGVVLRGSVVDHRGRPIAGADLALRVLGGGTSPNQHVERIASGRDGRFHFQEAPFGRVQLTTRAAGHGEDVRSLDLAADTELTVRLGASRLLAVHVHDPDGRPVAGVPVRITPLERPAQNHELRTDAEGRARFTDLGAPSWTVQVVTERYRPFARAAVQADGSELAIELVPWPCLDGRILVPGGKAPPAGTRVRVLPAGLRGDLVSGETTDPGDPVDEDGTFRVCAVRPGNYRIEARAPGYAPTRSEPVRVEDGADARADALILSAGGGLAVEVSGPGGPLERASVELFGSPPPEPVVWAPVGTTFARPLAAATADGRGRTRFEHLAAGSLWALVRAEEHLPVVVGPLTVLDGREGSPTDVRLVRGGRIEGTVRDGEGGPVEGALVLFMGHDEVPTTIHATTDAAGAFASPPLPGGAWHLRVRVNPGRSGRSAISTHTQTVETFLEAGGIAKVELDL